MSQRLSPQALRSLQQGSTEEARRRAALRAQEAGTWVRAEGREELVAEDERALRPGERFVVLRFS